MQLGLRLVGQQEKLLDVQSHIVLAFNFFNYYEHLQPQILSVHSSCPTIVRVSLDMFTILLHLFAALVVDDKCALRALYEIGVYILFTFFLSLTYAHHYSMKLIK